MWVIQMAMLGIELGTDLFIIYALPSKSNLTRVSEHIVVQNIVRIGFGRHYAGKLLLIKTAIAHS
jgi:hypothetical protein